MEKDDRSGQKGVSDNAPKKRKAEGNTNIISKQNDEAAGKGESKDGKNK